MSMWRAALAVVICQVSSLNVAVINEHPGDPISAAKDLLGRVLPHHVDSFVLKVVPKIDGAGAMTLGSQNGKIELGGSGGVELASALNWYLNDYLNVTVDWNTYGEGQLPKEGSILPFPTASGLQKVRQMPWSYYLNVCTYGYSLAFVPWSYWEKHIDWMALNGINLPLAFVGQEWLWLEVFQSFNLTFDDLTDFISGPAFLPWYRMGNMQKWGGPITMNWLEQRRDLQIQILARMRGLGMTPVLSAFAGHLPKAFSKMYPAAKISQGPAWAGFSGEYGNVDLLEPTDPYYKEIGSKFIEVQASVFGTDHIYNCDTYNEMNPPTSDPGYLSKASAAVYSAMASADSQAVWLMQGWLFFSARAFWQPAQVRAYLGGVSNESMWILDLYGASNPVWQSTEAFYGKPFIFCTLLNFGGQQGLTGNIPQMATGLAAAASKGAIGVGLTMEGIWQNYPAFEAQLQLSWQPAASYDHETYMSGYGARRYGGHGSGASAAWEALSSVYSGHGASFGSTVSSYPGSSLEHLLSAPACQYSDEQKSFYLAGCSDGSAGGCPKFVSLEQAKEACSGEKQCTGITLSHGAYELRGGGFLQPSPTSESSWLISNPVECHPGYVPAGAIWQTTWKYLLQDSPQLGNVSSYRFDLVDVGRQALSHVFDTKVSVFQAAFKAGNHLAVQRAGNDLLTIIDDYDRFLSTDSNFMLGPWLAWARSWGSDEAEKQWLEFNARNQITLWGPNGEINDYAKKDWGGLVRAYYRKRWEICVNQAATSAPTWDSKMYYDEVFGQVEQPFSKAPFADSYPVDPEEDAIVVARVLYSKYFGAQALIV